MIFLQYVSLGEVQSKIFHENLYYILQKWLSTLKNNCNYVKIYGRENLSKISYGEQL